MYTNCFAVIRKKVSPHYHLGTADSLDCRFTETFAICEGLNVVNVLSLLKTTFPLCPCRV